MDTMSSKSKKPAKKKRHERPSVLDRESGKKVVGYNGVPFDWGTVVQLPVFPDRGENRISNPLGDD